ncbi:MAG: D-2-hydroxyacid dehydrogenase [Clostridia bacterium]|nr:D-2-hydroxyacid dehydrogenase [Clostridia bacterium]
MILLVTGALKLTDGRRAELSALGNEVVYMPDERGELPIPADRVEGVICNGLFLYHPIEKFTSLKYVQLTSAGLDRVPADYLCEHGIALRNARGVYDVPMAEYAVWAVLSLFKGASAFARSRAERKWEKNRNIRELADSTVLIVGCGSVGGACAARFGALGARVIGVDARVREDGLYEAMYPTQRLCEAVSAADVIILTLPYTEDTRHIIDAEALSSAKRGAVLVNIARGGVVDTEALISALGSGVISGAALDVFEREPLSEDSPLWDMENVIITPHNSFVGEGNEKRIFECIIGNLEEL